MNIQNLSSISNLYKYYNRGIEHFRSDPDENKDCIINDDLFFTIVSIIRNRL